VAVVLDLIREALVEVITITMLIRGTVEALLGMGLEAGLIMDGVVMVAAVRFNHVVVDDTTKRQT
jgi:hypothetical protein